MYPPAPVVVRIVPAKCGRVLLTGLIAFGLALAASGVRAAEPPAGVGPFLAANCRDCHSGAEAEGGLDLDSLGRDLDDSVVAAKWARIHDRVRDGEMPPPDVAELPAAEADAFLTAVGSWVRDEQAARQREEGRVRGRRLTNLQLERSLHDLLGVDVPLAERMPEEPRVGGFSTVADGQSISHFQLERHLDIVDFALDEAWRRAVAGDKLWRKDLSAKALARTRTRCREPELIDGRIVVWSSRLTFYGRVPATTAREEGWYRFTIRGATSLKDDGEGVWTTVRSGRCVSSAPLMRWVGMFEATDEPKTVVFETWLPKGDMLEIRPGDATLKMARFEGGQVANGEGAPQDVPGVAVESITMERIRRGPDDEALRSLLFDDLPIERTKRGTRLVSADPQADAARLLARFARRAFRRPVSDAELAPYVAAVAESVAAGDGLLDSLRAGYRAVLCSPRFLYFHEEPGPLDGHAVASRLSYLLWNRPPDAELARLADAGRLREPGVLRAQVERMLADSRGAAFVPDFAAEWLDLSQIEATDLDPRLYRDFDVVVQQSMVDETHAFLAAMLREDLGVSHLIDSDFTFLNERLARFYGIDRVEGDELRRVALRPEDRRGGVLTHGAVLKVTANGTTTSPVIRGVWVGERLLGEHVPPPPQNVPAIEPDIRGATTIREMLAKHKSDASCASCHVKIDPPGFALENYDPAGRWRDRYVGLDKGRRSGGAVIDSSFETADGRPFEGIEEFRRIVLEDERRLARNVVEKLITYGTGAPPSFADREAVERAVDAAAGSGYGFRSLLHAVVASPVFWSK